MSSDQGFLEGMEYTLGFISTFQWLVLSPQVLTESVRSLKTQTLKAAWPWGLETRFISQCSLELPTSKGSVEGKGKNSVGLRSPEFKLNYVHCESISCLRKLVTTGSDLSASHRCVCMNSVSRVLHKAQRQKGDFFLSLSVYNFMFLFSYHLSLIISQHHHTKNLQHVLAYSK